MTSSYKQLTLQAAAEQQHQREQQQASRGAAACQTDGDSVASLEGELQRLRDQVASSRGVLAMLNQHIEQVCVYMPVHAACVCPCVCASSCVFVCIVSIVGGSLCY